MKSLMFMQKRKIVNAILVVALLVVTGISLTLFRQAEAKGQCHKINTTLTSQLVPPFNTAGEIKSGFLKGTTAFTGDPLSLTPITSMTINPTSSYTGDLVITTKKGTLTTRGVGVFEGVPFGLGTQFDRVVAGTDLFDGASGFLFFTFESDSTGGAFTSSVTGEVCVN